MDDRELREMIRESIARHLGHSAAAPPPAPPFHAHPSHIKLLHLHSGDEGACLIEPAVRCNHCGYCLSYGH
jgi:ferredoxin